MSKSSSAEATVYVETTIRIRTPYENVGKAGLVLSEAVAECRNEYGAETVEYRVQGPDDVGFYLEEDPREQVAPIFDSAI